MRELDQSAIEAFLNGLTIGHLGTVRQGRPYIVPIAFLYEHQTVYFATEPGGKLGDLQSGEEACFEADEYCPEIGEYRSVIGYGQAKVVQDPQERERILRRLIGRFERQASSFVTSKDYPAHAMAEHEQPQELMVVAMPLQELHGREAA
jgi:nitroimidazol reductase NimA-like FMN-containing flavoprotein (pyridoxamine 5'-phosphate oxidase superfamily)